MQSYDVLVAGAGHGGAQAAIALRQAGFGGTIALAGAEPDPPYERPPLSKDYLAGVKPFERLLIRPVAFWAERGIDLLLGRRLTAVDPDGRRVTTHTGETSGYGKLIWAAGGEPRRLDCEGAELSRVHTVRCRADVDRMIAELPEVRRVVVIGGGYIGLEAAAVLVKLGRAVTLLEALPRLLARVAGEPLSRFFAAEHRAHGVDIRFEAKVECIEGETHATGVRLAGGETIAADMVVVGIGIRPAVSPLLEAGAEAAAGGVLVDACCRTSLPHVYAIGDCAAHASAFADGAVVRIESVQNANDMATAAAKHICGLDAPYQAVPWFWSDQYDLKLQMVGLSVGHEVSVVRGEPEARSFSVGYFRRGRLVALDCVNAVKDYAAGRALVSAGLHIHPDVFADPAAPLKSLTPARVSA